MMILSILLLFFCSSVHAIETVPDQSLMRDLIILLDDVVETNPSKNGVDDICILQNALQEEAAPLLVNASLWCTYIESRQEWTLQASIPGTAEYKMTILMQNINDRIQYWYDLLTVNGSVDDLHARTLVVERINEEFYTKTRYKQFQEEGLIPKNIDTLSIIKYCSITPCFFDAWHWFYLDTGYYLAIPKKYSAQYTDSTYLADILCAAGFNPTLAVCETDPLDIPLLKIIFSEPFLQNYA